MPIKPENKARYPKNWPVIRAEILQRDGHRCKFCEVRNHAWGWRDGHGRFHQVPKRTLKDAGYRKPPFILPASDGRKFRVIEIVLTIAHLHDMRPENVDDDNLAALCQRCHNRHDAKLRQANAAATRRARAASGDLFPADRAKLAPDQPEPPP